MDFFEAVEKRYSHKENFLPTPVPLEHLKRIAKAGLLAPNGMNRQMVHMVILPDRESVAKLCAVSPCPGLKTAPAAIAVLTDSTQAPPPPHDANFEKEDYSAAAANMLLAATALSYASVWLDSPYWGEEQQKGALKVLGAPNTFKLWVVLPIGKPDGEGSRRNKLPPEQRISYGQFGCKL